MPALPEPISADTPPPHPPRPPSLPAVLMQHQKAKHFKCRLCPRKLNTVRPRLSLLLL